MLLLIQFTTRSSVGESFPFWMLSTKSSKDDPSVMWQTEGHDVDVVVAVVVRSNDTGLCDDDTGDENGVIVDFGVDGGE